MRRQQFIKPFYEIGINEGYCANSIIVRLCFCVKLTAEVSLHQNCHYSERKSRLVCRERQMVWRAHCSRESSRLCAIISWSTRTIKLWASMSLHFPIVVQVCHLLWWALLFFKWYGIHEILIDGMILFTEYIVYDFFINDQLVKRRKQLYEPRIDTVINTTVSRRKLESFLI